eukprot:15364909-Ditylum_brightwellii.AAC.2
MSTNPRPGDKEIENLLFVSGDKVEEEEEPSFGAVEEPMVTDDPFSVPEIPPIELDVNEEKAEDIVIPLPMSMYAEILLGMDCYMTAQSQDDVHVIKEDIKKSKCNNLDAKQLHNLQQDAEATLPTKFAMLCTKPGTQNLENVYNISLWIKDFRKKALLYDMADEFMSLNYDEHATQALLLNTYKSGQ